ncbi:hypothetical protein HYDPIDRAFT_174797 [Hydnomerulius pinastri MD-312]|nr:hypothetical protein HYDPIDRAFT_174797 [Hydnomerulius pinastri MD-312]
MHNPARKFIDLVLKLTDKWVNWDPPIPIKVGDYGTVNAETGELNVDGNIYDLEFQEHLDDQSFNFKLSEHKPVYGAPEQDFIVSSTGVKKGDLSVNHMVGIPDVASASIKGQWHFQKGKRGVLVIAHQPRQQYIPKDVMSKLAKVTLLKGKSVVTSVLACPAYLLYLSNKTGETISVALQGSTPVLGAAGVTVTTGSSFEWHTDCDTAFLRRACSRTGEPCFTPIFALKHKVPWYAGLLFRDSSEAEPTDEDLWQDEYQPWRPLDEDGDEEELADVLENDNMEVD